VTAIDQKLADEIAALGDPAAILKELFTRFGERVAIGTSGQLSGVVMIDMAVQAGVKPRVFTIDTLRLFPETLELFEAVEKRYKIKLEILKPDPARLKSMIAEHGEHLFFDSKAKQELCCHIRKVEPNEKMLDQLDVWISGLRRDQSPSRESTQLCEIIHHGDDERSILKVAPLVDWTEDRLRAYIKENDVPVHKLLDWNENGWHYESLGCIICTTPIGPNEPRRAGRWRWFNDNVDKGSVFDHKECGLHTAHKDTK